MSDEDVESFALDPMFDISDIAFDIQRNKSATKIYLIMKSESNINLMRFYLSLKQYLFKMEQEIGVFDESPEVH